MRSVSAESQTTIQAGSHLKTRLKWDQVIFNRWQIKIDQVSFLCSNRFSFCWLPSMLSAHLWLAWQICKLPTAGQWSIETGQVPASSHGCSKIYCGLFNLHIGTISDTCVMPCALGPGLFPLFWILFGQNVFAFWWHRAYKTASMRSREQLGQSSSDWNILKLAREDMWDLPSLRTCLALWRAPGRDGVPTRSPMTGSWGNPSPVITGWISVSTSLTDSTSESKRVNWFSVSFISFSSKLQLSFSVSCSTCTICGGGLSRGLTTLREILRVTGVTGRCMESDLSSFITALLLRSSRSNHPSRCLSCHEHQRDARNRRCQILAQNAQGPYHCRTLWYKED